jgi:acetyl esterase
LTSPDIRWETERQGVPGQLDPDVDSILELIALRGVPKISELPVAEARREFQRQLDKTNPPAPAGVVAADFHIPGPGGRLPLRRYSPGGQPAGQGTLLFFHGGGFVLGDLASHDPICRIIAARTGSTVIAVDYRLAPEHPYPAAVEDAFAALQWLAAEGPAAEPLGVCGDSAGGSLAAVAALHARDRGLPLALQILVYPAVDQGGDFASRRRLAEGHLLTEADIIWFGQHYFCRPDTPILDWTASPLRASSHAGVAPAVILTAGFDPLCDEGAAYAAALAAANVPVRHVRLEGAIHGCLGLARLLDCGRQALDEICAAWGAVLPGT